MREASELPDRVLPHPLYDLGMAQVQMKRSQTDCGELKNKGKIIYAGDNQYPLETIKEVSSTDTPFTVQFYTFINAFDGEQFEGVTHIEVVGQDGASPVYKLFFEDESTATVSRKIKSITEE